jgi:DNA invertase Pin-like site-specific DNA recombinase
MRATIYSRFSTDRQSESSIEDQVRICEEYARQEAMTVCERFADHGISGASIGNRPGYMKLREALLGRRFDVVLVSDLTRLSRSSGDLNKEIDRFVARGIRVVGVQDGYDSARKGHKLQAGLSGIIGEAFRDMVKDRTYAALESRARSARPTGGKCYGYRNGTVVESEAAIVREIFERFAGGASCRAIAADLNARGVPSPGRRGHAPKGAVPAGSARVYGPCSEINATRELSSGTRRSGSRTPIPANADAEPALIRSGSPPTSRNCGSSATTCTDERNVELAWVTTSVSDRAANPATFSADC